MMSAYPRVERRHVVPADRGLSSVGHMGFFKEDAAALWEDVVDWLERI